MARHQAKKMGWIPNLVLKAMTLKVNSGTVWSRVEDGLHFSIEWLMRLLPTMFSLS